MTILKILISRHKIVPRMKSSVPMLHFSFLLLVNSILTSGGGQNQPQASEHFILRTLAMWRVLASLPPHSRQPHNCIVWWDLTSVIPNMILVSLCPRRCHCHYCVLHFSRCSPMPWRRLRAKSRSMATEALLIVNAQELRRRQWLPTSAAMLPHEVCQ